MALDSLGLGLTLDTTLLAKADKTLENMAKNSKLVMQNLTRGITAFNEGKITDFTQVLGHMSSALDKLSKTEVSPDFDTTGQDKFIDRMQHIMSMMEKMSKIKGAKFYDPTEVYVTDKDATDIFGEMQALQEYKKELAELVNIIKNYGPIQQGLKEEMGKLGGEITEQEKEVKALSLAYDEAKKKQEAALKAMATQFKAFSTRERKKDPSLTDEQLLGMFASKVSMQKYVEEVTKANEELVRAEEKLMESTEKLEGYQSRLNATQQEYKSNIGIKQKEDEIKASYDLIKEQEKILQAEMKYAQATEAERAAMLTQRNEAEIKADQKRVREKQKEYENLRKAIQKGEKEIADLEASRATLKEAGRSTRGIDAEIKKRRDELNELMKDELEFRSSQYWPKLQAIDEKFNSEAFIKNQKALAKLAAKESRKDVTAAIQFSTQAKTINEEKEAIKRLIEARDNLSTSTARYKKTVEDINKRILAHKDHIEAVTRVEKEQNTLADSVINRYRKQLKALDEVNEALEKQMKIERKTSIADLDPTNADTQALLARQKTIAADIANIESRAQGELDVIKEQHEAERAKKRIEETLRQNEREKQEYAKLLDELYALEKQKKAMEEAGGGVGDAAYDKLIQQENDLNARKSQLEAKHQNDLDEIRKKHDKKRNDDEVKAFIEAEKEKQKTALESLKKRAANEKKYGTISGATAERLISYTDSAKNVAQHKKAIDSLQRAREKLDNTDKDYLKTVKKLNEAIKYHEIEIELTEDKSNKLMQTHRGLMDIGGQLMRRLALAFSVSQLTQYFRKLVEVRGEFEKQEVALQTLLKSKYQANILMQQVTDLAVKSPFTLQQLIGYTKQLAAYQIEYKKLYSTTKMLADVSAGLGVEMDRLILAFGQVRAANYLRATEVRQFTEAGMDILGELAKYYSELEGKMVSVADVQERVTKRMVGFSDVEEVFKRVTSAGGIFYDMQAKQAETLSGQWSNLQDKIGIMFNEIGKGTDGLLKGIVRFLASIVDNWEKASTVLTALVGSFVAVKINTALASKELIKFVRTMGLIKGRVKSVTILQTLGAVFVKLGKSIKSAALAMKGFAVSHPIITALTLLATLIGTVYKEWRRQEEAAKNVRKQYDELSESVEKLTVAFNRMGREGDFEGQKKQLEELVTLANNEYQMNIRVNLEGATAEEVTQQFIELQQKMLLLNSFATDFNTDYAQSGKQTEKSMKKYGEVAKETLKSLVQDAERVAFTLDKLESEGVKLTDSQVEARNKLAEPRQINESELDYLQRLMEAFDLLTYEYENMEEERARALQGLDFDSEEYTKTAMDFTRSLIDIQDRMSEMGLSIGDITKIYSKYNKAQGDAIKKYNEFLDKVEVPSILTDEGKEERIKFAIDTYAAQNQWDEFMINLAYDLANNKFVINITPEVDLPSDDKLKAWQKTYNEKFAKYEGFTKIGKSDTTQSHQIDILNDAFKKQEELVKQIEKVGTQGAYQGYKLADEQKKLAQIVAQLNWFGIDPKTKGKDEVLEKLKNRINLIKEMNKEYERLRKTFSEEESLEKVRKAYEDTAKELGLDASTMDFTDAGTIKSLEDLLGKPEYAANKYVLELQKALDNFKVELGITTKQGADEELKNEIQKLFDQYDLTLELKKLNIPPELAKSLFDVDYLDLDGLKKAVQEQESKFVGTDMEQDYEDFLKKINELSRKAQEDEAKEFINFLKKNLDDIKLVQDKGAHNIALADRLFGEGKITAEQYLLSIRQIVEDTNKEVAKINLEKFKDSSTYIKAMGNLAAYSRKELEGMISALQEQVGTNAGNMGADEIRAYYEAIERLVDQYDKLKSPFQKGEINDLIEYLGLQKQLNQEKEKEAALEQRKTELNVHLALLQERLALQQASGDTMGAERTQELIKNTVNELKEVDGQLVSVTSNISVISEKVANLGDGMVKGLVVAQKVVNEIANIAEASTKMFDDIKSAADALGADTESGGWAKAGYAMEMVGGVSSELTSGLANLASGNFAGALANVVGIVTKLISGFAKIHDQNYQDIIEAQAKEVERLGKAYEKLEKATEDAYSIEQLQQANKELERNVELQMQALRAMIAAEKAKKNTDEEQIAAWNEELEALTQQWEDLKQSLIEGVGGVSDYRSQTREFVDSWVSAFQETGDGLSGLQKDFREFFDNIIAEQAALRVTEKFLAPFYESLNTSLEDLKLTEEESKNLREEADKIMPELSKALELIWNQLGGSRGEADGGSLSALQKGIQGITEDTAQIIEAYLNSIRGYVSEQVTHTKNIYRILNDAVHSDAAAIRVRMV